MCANELRTNIVEILKKTDVKELSIGDVIRIKNLLGLTDSEAINIFLGV